MLVKANHRLARLSDAMARFQSGPGIAIAGPVAGVGSTSANKRTIMTTGLRSTPASSPSSVNQSSYHFYPYSTLRRLDRAPSIGTLTSNRFPQQLFLATNKASISFTNRHAMSSNPADIQARQQTLQVLDSIGLDLQWSPQYKFAIPKSSDQAGKIGEKTTQYIQKLVSEAQSVSFENLVSSLLAGPDNESDEPVDVPVFLGKPAGVKDEDAKQLQDWVLKTLGIPSGESLTVREQLVPRPQDSTTPSLSATSVPYVLSRLSRAKAFQTQSKDSSASDSQFESLKTALDQLQPRWSFEVKVQSKIVCVLVGRPAGLEGEWVGLISYRVAT